MSQDVKERDSDERAQELLSLYVYEPETGLIKNKRGKTLGYMTHAGYIRIGYKKKGYQAHRLAWLFTHGKWPKDQIDHINHNRADNRIVNLREADGALNMMNMSGPRRSNRTGLLGVSAPIYGRYRASIFRGRKKIDLGTYSTPEEAHAAYLEAKLAYHPEVTALHAEYERTRKENAALQSRLDAVQEILSGLVGPMDTDFDPGVTHRDFMVSLHWARKAKEHLSGAALGGESPGNEEETK